MRWLFLLPLWFMWYQRIFKRQNHQQKTGVSSDIPIRRFRVTINNEIGMDKCVFQHTETDRCNHNFLKNALLELLQNFLWTICKKLWFQNDGVPAHFATTLRNYQAATFERWLIGAAHFCESLKIFEYSLLFNMSVKHFVFLEMHVNLPIDTTRHVLLLFGAISKPKFSITLSIIIPFISCFYLDASIDIHRSLYYKRLTECPLTTFKDSAMSL